MVETLSELLQRCRTGDADAVAALVGRFRHWALDLARALVHDDGLAEDVVQETFLAALRGLDGLRDADAFPGWLRQILRRQAGRMTRKYGDAVPWDAEQIGAEDACPNERVERDELHKIVRDALDRLPPTERDTAVRFYIEQQRCSEIAQTLSVPPGTVRRRLFDARARLRDMLLGFLDDGHEVRNTKSSPTDLPF
ncbi:MAG: sigma-70 family RNA polymerase sigma factor [Candidatus Hydrogenedentes bacterium]|nr:sigma-70 family RNA polymerase sigma factor [Candidatus Hydrogenedentota bacterium]